MALEGNLITRGKIKKQVHEQENKNRERSQERRKPREENPRSNTSKEPSDSRMDEINKALRNITSQMARIKSDPNVPAQFPPRNSSVYRRPNNPQFLQQDRRNEDQTIQTLVRKDINNLKDEDDYLEELPPIEEEEEEEKDYW